MNRESLLEILNLKVESKQEIVHTSTLNLNFMVPSKYVSYVLNIIKSLTTVHIACLHDQIVPYFDWTEENQKGTFLNQNDTD